MHFLVSSYFQNIICGVTKSIPKKLIHLFVIHFNSRTLSSEAKSLTSGFLEGQKDFFLKDRQSTNLAFIIS